MSEASADDFFNLMEWYQIADQLDPLLKQQDHLKTNKDDTKKLMEKSNDKNIRLSQRKMILVCRHLKSHA